jgi:hypothetical protein
MFRLPRIHVNGSRLQYGIGCFGVPLQKGATSRIDFRNVSTVRRRRVDRTVQGAIAA